MSSVVTQSSPTEPQPQQDRILNAMAWVELHRKQLVLGLVGLIALWGVVYLWRHFRSEREARANAALLEVRTSVRENEAPPKASDFLKVAEEHAATSVASRARLMAAGAFFSEGQYSEALTEFEKVAAAEGSSVVGAQAAFGVAACLDAQDKADQAMAKYQEVVAQFPEDSVVGQAKLAMARLHESKKQPEAALRIYDDLIRAKDAGAFSQQATEQREALLRDHPNLSATNAAAPVAATAGK